MAVCLTATLLVAFLCGAATAGITHNVTWNRFQLGDKFPDRTLTVELGDTIELVCQVEQETKPGVVEDVNENLVLLTNELQVNSCDPGNEPSESFFLDSCLVTGFDYSLQVTPAQLASQPSFLAGEVYYLTSFSDGTRNGATDISSKGGSCARDPPLILTVSVSATSTSSVAPISTSLSSSSIISTSTKSSTVEIKRTPTPPVIVLPDAPAVVGNPGDNGAGHIVSSNFIVLIVLATLAYYFIV